MSWQPYISNLVDGTVCTDAAIYGLDAPHGVWAAHPGGQLSQITSNELAAIVCPNRSQLFINGICLGGVKCSLLRDLWGDESSMSMDVRTKCADGPTFNIVIFKTNKAIVILKAGDGVHGGAVNQKCYETVKYLRQSGY